MRNATNEYKMIENDIKYNLMKHKMIQYSLL